MSLNKHSFDRPEYNAFRSQDTHQDNGDGWAFATSHKRKDGSIRVLIALPEAKYDFLSTSESDVKKGFTDALTWKAVVNGYFVLFVFLLGVLAFFEFVIMAMTECLCAQA